MNAVTANYTLDTKINVTECSYATFKVPALPANTIGKPFTELFVGSDDELFYTIEGKFETIYSECPLGFV